MGRDCISEPQSLMAVKNTPKILLLRAYSTQSLIQPLVLEFINSTHVSKGGGCISNYKFSV